MKIIMAAFFAALLLIAQPAQARHHRHHHYTRHHTVELSAKASSGDCQMTNEGHTVCDGAMPASYSQHEYTTHHAVLDGNGNIISHPAGCPRIAFCGCGASVRIFGHPIRSLYLAANWFKFPHAAPAPGMVAVRSHHVFVIEQAYGDGTVLAYDANSGNHATRIHRVSLQGYSVRNPHGA